VTPSGRTDPAWTAAFNSVYPKSEAAYATPEKRAEMEAAAAAHADRVTGQSVASKIPDNRKPVPAGMLEAYMKKFGKTLEEAKAAARKDGYKVD
jgi:hypothetical protein